MILSILLLFIFKIYNVLKINLFIKIEKRILISKIVFINYLLLFLNAIYS